MHFVGREEEIVFEVAAVVVEQPEVEVVVEVEVEVAEALDVAAAVEMETQIVAAAAAEPVAVDPAGIAFGGIAAGIA